MTVHLNGLATAVPGNVLTQERVLETARRVLGPRHDQFERMASSFVAAGVERRYSFADIDWFNEPKFWPQRNDLYLAGATAIFIDVARAALDNAGLVARDIDTVVTVSSTGIATPTLEARAWKAMGFRDDIHRVPVFGLGCAGGVSGMAIAERLATATPHGNVLLVVLEACTLSFRSDRLQKADIIATMLFGDGAAAACLSTRPGAAGLPTVTLAAGQEVIWRDTLDIMGWDVDESGLGVIFERSIPSFVRDRFGAATQSALARTGRSMQGIERFVCHPGGPKVLGALESALALVPGSLDIEREVLRDFGNMSAPTVLFVLERVIRAGLGGRMLLCALGPGFTAAFLPLTIGAADD